jgi:hypothetical protein
MEPQPVPGTHPGPVEAEEEDDLERRGYVAHVGEGAVPRRVVPAANTLSTGARGRGVRIPGVRHVGGFRGEGERAERLGTGRARAAQADTAPTNSHTKTRFWGGITAESSGRLPSTVM